ncbi:MAG: ABC transporter ATP-binding protein/permease [Lachnospiraceae bacterium]|nr:ABC transporter ATP-binding protein/permease [Lachnospiraceae bacterium]
MLKLKEIKKNYLSGENEVHALKGVSLTFREKEFVSILGQSGCGKTTMLNIIGGLDHYTSGDLVINGISTKEYKDRDWDAYRNHTIGFVFQSYNLIPHQNVLSNVELALTLSGVSKSERRKKAKEALEKVGLGDQLNKKPNQLSGGQMQRVAIARALVNDPDILLADEPTGALDSETSVQVMDLLKEVAKEKLVIMVTHNGELADKYSTRIIRLLDGKVIGDTNPVSEAEEKEILAASKKEQENKNAAAKGKKERTSMSMRTALGLSVNNLMTKKGRTILTAFAGSIGIIGIALIMSLSNGIQTYIDSMEEETMSSYPITIEKEVVDLTSTIQIMMSLGEDPNYEDKNVIHSKNVVGAAFQSMVAESKSNNLIKFKEFLDNSKEMDDATNAIQYKYNIVPVIYTDKESKNIQINPLTVLNEMMGDTGVMTSMMSSNPYRDDVWVEMLDNEDLMKSQFELVDGQWPQGENECVLVADEYNQIYDLTLYSMGLKDPEDLNDIIVSAFTKIGDKDAAEKMDTEDQTFSYDELIGSTYRLVLPTDFYVYDEEEGYYVNKSDDQSFVDSVVASSEQIKLVGIIRVKDDVKSTTIQPGTVAYTTDLTKKYIKRIEESAVVQAQLKTPDIDVTTGLPFEPDEKNQEDSYKVSVVDNYVASGSDTVKADFFKKIYSAPNTDEINAMVEVAMTQYPDRDSKIQYMKDTTKQMISMVKSGKLSSEELVAMGMDEASLSYMTSMSDEEIDNIFEKTYSALSDAEVDKAFSQTLYSNIAYANSADATELNSYSIEELADMLDDYYALLTDEEKAAIYDNSKSLFYSPTTYDSLMAKLGLCYEEEPSMINIYVKSFDDKEKVKDLIDEYNKNASEEDKITYTDYAGLMMKSISNMIDIISYVLIAFVSISLVVSSIMIGIITYISVLERTKEIGILRAIGASKKDIRHVFNSEAISVGFVSGMIGILVTVLLNIPISIIIKHLTDVAGIAKLPVLGGVALVLISMFLTFIAGLLPSRVAAKKDPVIALRSE